MNWHDIFTYVNGKLYWKVKPAVRVNMGDEAGTIHYSGYVSIIYKRKWYRAHRIIWEMHNGPIPDGMEIDHIDHNILNNLLNNLRLVSRTDNMRNRSIASNNTSGVMGVSWDNKSNKWRVRISDKGKRKLIGFFEDFDDAVQARRDAEAAYSYHPNHNQVLKP